MNSYNTRNLATSMPYYEDELIWCVKRASKKPIFLNLFYVQPVEIWLMNTFIFGFGCAALIFLLIQFEKNKRIKNRLDLSHTVLLIALPSFLGFTCHFRPTSGSVRLLYGFVLLTPTFIYLMFQVYLYHYMKSQFFFHQIGTVNEIISKRFRLVGSLEVLNAIKQNKAVNYCSQILHVKSYIILNFTNNYFQYPYEQVESFRVREHIDGFLVNLEQDDFLAVGDSRQHILNAPNYSPNKIFCFNDYNSTIKRYSVSLIMRRNSELKSRIDNIIQRLFEAGLFYKWAQNSHRTKKFETSYVATFQVNLEHLYMPLVLVFLVGPFITVSTFLIELITFRKLRQHNRSQIWVYISEQLDGNRHYFISGMTRPR